MSSAPRPAYPMQLGDTGAWIRPSTPVDLEVLQVVREAAFAPVFCSFRTIVGVDIADVAFPHLEAEQRKLLEDIAAPESGQSLFVAVVDGEIVGFVAFSADKVRPLGEIGLNAVHPDHVGKGIGTAMYRFALDRLKELGVAVVEVGTGGDPSHAAARRAYEKVGFVAAIPSVHMYRKL